MKKIAIATVSGQLGAAIAEACIEKYGVDNVVGIARTPSKSKVSGIEVRPGDFDEPASLETALSNCDRAVLVSSNAPAADRITQHRNVFAAADKVGVKHMVYTSILAGEEGEGFNDIVKSNRDTEAALADYNFDWTVGRNSIYIEPDWEFAQEYIKTGKITNSAGDGLCGYTTRAELGAAYAAILGDKKHFSKIYNLTGPNISQSELAGIINQVYGAKIQYQSQSIADYKEDCTNRLGDYMGGIIAGIYEGINKGAFEKDSDFETITGRPHQTVLEFFKSKHS